MRFSIVFLFIVSSIFASTPDWVKDIERNSFESETASGMRFYGISRIHKKGEESLALKIATQDGLEKLSGYFSTSTSSSFSENTTQTIKDGVENYTNNTESNTALFTASYFEGIAPAKEYKKELPNKKIRTFVLFELTYAQIEKQKSKILLYENALKNIATLINEKKLTEAKMELELIFGKFPHAKLDTRATVLQQRASKSARVTIEAKNSLIAGDQLALRINSTATGHLYLFLNRQNGTKTMLFPNPAEKYAEILTDQSLVLPTKLMIRDGLQITINREWEGEKLTLEAYVVPNQLETDQFVSNYNDRYDFWKISQEEELLRALTTSYNKNVDMSDKTTHQITIEKKGANRPTVCIKTTDSKNSLISSGIEDYAKEILQFQFWRVKKCSSNAIELTIDIDHTTKKDQHTNSLFSNVEIELEARYQNKNWEASRGAKVLGIIGSNSNEIIEAIRQNQQFRTTFQALLEEMEATLLQ